MVAIFAFSKSSVRTIQSAKLVVLGSTFGSVVGYFLLALGTRLPYISDQLGTRNKWVVSVVTLALLFVTGLTACDSEHFFRDSALSFILIVFGRLAAVVRTIPVELLTLERFVLYPRLFTDLKNDHGNDRNIGHNRLVRIRLVCLFVTLFNSSGWLSQPPACGDER